METTTQIMFELEIFSTLVADAILKKTSPVKDELSTREARAAYGSRWLREATEAGLVQAHVVSNRKVYSRHQLDCLRAAQSEHATRVIENNRRRRNNDTESI